MKIYESETQIVYRGIDHELIKKHIEEKVEKILCIYDTERNFLKFSNDEFNYNSHWLAFYAIKDIVSNEWIIERHSKLESDFDIEWKPIAGKALKNKKIWKKYLKST